MAVQQIPRLESIASFCGGALGFSCCLALLSIRRTLDLKATLKGIVKNQKGMLVEIASRKLKMLLGADHVWVQLCQLTDRTFS